MEALLYEKRSDLTVRCLVCNHFCNISNGKRGICGVRENKNGILYALNFNKSIATSIDPIEKKPLYEFLPGTFTYSFATVGCNMDCAWCQNNLISQDPKPQNVIRGKTVTAKEHIKNALKYNCPSISYTYSEPTIFLEYALETMKLAKKENLKNVWVSNGFMSDQTLELILPYLDAANIDYKGNDMVYKKYCIGRKQPILDNLKRMKEAGVHLEITTLIITGINDTTEKTENIIKDLISALGTDFIWHITRFFPHYKMLDTPITSKYSLIEARKIGYKYGIKNIYLGNI